MGDLNQLAISKTLGSKIAQIGPVGFGNFRLRQSSEEIQEALRGEDDCEDSSSYEEVKAVVQAFEEVRRGAPTDELLWNKDLARSFIKKCHEAGVKGPDGLYIRRLINVRKNAPRYKKHGVKIAPTTKKETHPSIVPQYAHVIEFALVKLRYRFGVSIDDILMDQSLGQRFEDLAGEIAPEISSKDLRLGALYIRKNRVIKKRDSEAINALDLNEVESAWKGAVSLADVVPKDLPATPGLIELKENERYLYISHNKDIQAAISHLQTGKAFDLVANSFWKPQLQAITLFFAPGEQVGGVSIAKWERKLIHDLDPILNWPMPRRVA
jgi:hypothetical protein